VNDSILWGTQLIELDSADLRATRERGTKRTPSSTDENKAQTVFNSMLRGISQVQGGSRPPLNSECTMDTSYD